MKWLFLLIVLGGAGFALWRFQDEIFKAVDSITGKDDSPAEVADDGGSDGSSDSDGSDSGGKPFGGNTPPRAKNGNNNEDARAADIARQYPMPVFKPIEELVSNWTAVPASAFPRKITLKSDVKFEFAGGAGSTNVKAGREALALSLAAGTLVIAPREGSPLRGRVPLAETTFQEVLATAYEGYKERKRSEVVKQRERANHLAANAPAGTGPISASSSADVRPSDNLLKEYEVKLGKMPTRAADGTVPIMVNSIRNGDVNEIKVNEINHWGPIRYEIVERQPYWTATVNYITASLFGTFPTEAMALMRHGKVEAWVYTGSMEEVP